MPENSQPTPNVETQASRRHLKQALDALDLSDAAMSKDGGCLFCREGQLVIRQGYTERAVPCIGTFEGQFSISFTSLQKWRRAQKAVAGDETLHFSEGQLRVCRLELPAKWKVEVDIPAFAVPKVRPPEPPARMMRDEVRSSDISAISKTCSTYRVNVDRKELQEVLAVLGREKNAEVQLRTWNGTLILTDGFTEHRVDAEGKIDGFSVIPAGSVEALSQVPGGSERYITLVCEKHELKILGARVKTPRQAVPYKKPN